MGRIKRQIRWPRQPPLDPDRPDDPRPAARRPPRAGPARALRGRRRVDPLAGSPPPVRPPFEPAPCISRPPPRLAPAGRPRKLAAAGRDGDAVAGRPLPLPPPDPQDRETRAVDRGVCPRNLGASAAG